MTIDINSKTTDLTLLRTRAVILYYSLSTVYNCQKSISLKLYVCILSEYGCCCSWWHRPMLLDATTYELSTLLMLLGFFFFWKWVVSYHRICLLLWKNNKAIMTIIWGWYSTLTILDWLFSIQNFLGKTVFGWQIRMSTSNE